MQVLYPKSIGSHLTRCHVRWREERAQHLDQRRLRSFLLHFTQRGGGCPSHTWIVALQERQQECLRLSRAGVPNSKCSYHLILPVRMKQHMRERSKLRSPQRWAHALISSCIYSSILNTCIALKAYSTYLGPVANCLSFLAEELSLLWHTRSWGVTCSFVQPDGSVQLGSHVSLFYTLCCDLIDNIKVAEESLCF
jgi:hypothetical protein